MDSLELDTNIWILRTNARTMISSLLNPPKLIESDDKIQRDWQGLAELCGISGERMNSIGSDPDPTLKVLKIWQDMTENKATIGELLSFLEKMDRIDVIDDISPLIAEDLKFHKENLSKEKTVPQFDFKADQMVLTRDDVIRLNKGLEPQRYDAFVLFADDDIDFATELIENMEKNYNLKFCVKERDLVVAVSEHDAVVKLIAERCGRLLVILSPAFFESNARKFYMSLAQSIAIEQMQRKIIPCIYKECGPLPPDLNCYFKLDYRRTGPFWNFWVRLHESIIMPEYKPEPKLSLPENSLSLSREDMSALGNSMSRSVSNPNQLLLPDEHTPNSIPHDRSRTVMFASLTNLSNTEVPKDKIVPSTSANNIVPSTSANNNVPSTSTNSLVKYQEPGVKKSQSFYKKLKSNIFPKSKSKNGQQSSDPEQTALNGKKLNGNIASSSDESNVIENKIEGEDIEETDKGTKEKKKTLTWRRNKKKRPNKKKAELADT